MARPASLQAAPFDAVAAEYDACFTDRRLGRWLRRMVWQRLEELFEPGQHVLELGCGTGADAVRLAQRGVRVLATDASPEMLRMARAKAMAAGVAASVTFARLDLNSPLSVGDQPDGGGAAIAGAGGEPFDGAYSSFGALNCVADRRAVAGLLARAVRPAGNVVVVVMGPLCPWEMLWHLLHGEIGRATRRLRAERMAHVGHGRYVRVGYPSPRRLAAELAPEFRPVGLEGVGALLPPTQLSHLVDRWPGAFEALALLEDRVRRKSPWTWLNDHYLATFRRV